MPRRPKEPPPPPPAHSVPVIRPNGLYFRETAMRVLRLARDAIRDEIASGRLRAVQVCSRYYIKGQWILDWLEQGKPA